MQLFLKGLLLILLLLVAGVVGKTIFWTVPREILKKKYDIIPRKKGIAYIAAGVLAIAVSLAFIFAQAALVPITGGSHIIITVGLIMGGFVSIVQGLGILLFGIKEAGILGGIYTVLLAIVWIFYKYTFLISR